MSREHLVIGPPGTGKTTYLARQATRAADEVGADAVMIASLTRAAAQEIAGRDTPIPRRCVGTLHAHAYRALDKPELAETPEGLKAWSEFAEKEGLIWKIGGGAAQNLDYAPEQRSEGQGEALLAAMGTLRARCAPLELWPPKVLRFAEAWNAWKEKTGRLDFTDLIERALEEVARPPTDPRIIFLDEAQDLSKLEFDLARKWAQSCEQIVVVGDPDQCQPAGTMVTTTSGQVPIEDLDPEVHRLVCFDRHSSTVVGRRDGYAFEIAHRKSPGALRMVSAGGKRTRCTSDHRWPVKWVHDREVWVVYMMRKGEDYRVGWCQLHGASGLHLATRARLDGADETWVLKAFKDKREAALYEIEVAVVYGLPLPTFREADAFHQIAYMRDEIKKRAMQCLRAHRLDPRHPLLSKSERNVKRGRRTSWEVRTCNLIPGLMQIAVRRDERTCEWAPVELFEAGSADVVYSLNVEPHHNYIADGMVTSNCLYQWRGTDPEAMLSGEHASEIVLAQSWRVPEAVHDYAVGWIEQVEGRPPVDYKPRLVDPDDSDAGFAPGEVRRGASTWRDPEGIVRRAIADAERGETVMILASCGYMLEPTISVLKRQGVPFWNPYRATHGGWNPLRGARRLLALLRPDPATWGDEARWYDWLDMRAWAEPLRAKENLARGAKDLIVTKARDAKADDMAEEIPRVPMNMLPELLATEDLAHLVADVDMRPNEVVGWWTENLLAEAQKAARYPAAVYASRGGAALREKPRIVVGTIHSVKGGQADCSPSDEPVLTANRGWVPIADLDPHRDRLVSFNSDHHKIHRGGPRRPNGYEFIKAERPYQGPMLTFETDGSQTRITPNHRLTVRWSERIQEAHAVYLMRRGRDWRIGVTRMNGQHGQSGPLTRLNHERGEAAWLLHLCDTRNEALAQERLIAWSYGVPDLTFRVSPNEALSQEEQDEIWRALDSETPALRLLSDKGMRPDWPVWGEAGAAKRRQSGLRNRWPIRAANFWPDYMEIPVDPGRGQVPVWMKPSVEAVPFDGTVFSLEVQPWRHYVSGGAIVHNSVYVFPDLSHRGWVTTWERPSSRAPTFRLFYVAFTRARERLTICEAAGGEAAALPVPESSPR